MASHKIDFYCPEDECDFTVRRGPAARKRAVCPHHGVGDFPADEEQYQESLEMKRGDAL